MLSTCPDRFCVLLKYYCIQRAHGTQRYFRVCSDLVKRIICKYVLCKLFRKSVRVFVRIIHREAENSHMTSPADVPNIFSTCGYLPPSLLPKKVIRIKVKLRRQKRSVHPCD